MRFLPPSFFLPQTGFSPPPDEVDPASFQPLSQEDFSRAKGHVYPLLLVRLGLFWVANAHTSFRAASLVFSSLTGIFFVKGPCAETVRLWLLRVGLFLLQRPLPPCNDWVYILDMSIQLGQNKVLVVLGVSLSRFRQLDSPLTHHDVYILSIKVLASCSGEIIDQHLKELSQRTTPPVQIVSDHGSDIWLGIRLFRQDFPKLIEIHDVTHGLALLLKDRLEPSARWDECVKNCQRLRAQIQQTAGSFLRPPAWRQKARYLNLEGLMAWAKDMLLLLSSKEDETLAKELKSDTVNARAWLEEKMGWLRDFQADIATWCFYQEVCKDTWKQIKEKGLTRGSWRTIAKGLQPKTKEEKKFLKDVRKFVREEGMKLPENGVFVGSTDVLESMFGKYKEIADHGPTKEITANVLMIPLFVTPLTPELLREALETVHEDDVDCWLQDQLGPSPQQKKLTVLQAAHADFEGQKLA